MSNTASNQKSQEGLFSQGFLKKEYNLSADSGQDKYSSSPCNPASSQPYNNYLSALQNQKTPHLDTRPNIYAGSWVDQTTDAYIRYRVREGKQKDKGYSRSKAIRDIIRERAQDETFKGSQAILVAALQETMRAEHRREEDRFLALHARIAYQMAWALILLMKFVSFVLKDKAEALIGDSETAARANLTRRTPQIEEAIGKYKESFKE